MVLHWMDSLQTHIPITYIDHRALDGCSSWTGLGRRPHRFVARAASCPTAVSHTTNHHFPSHSMSFRPSDHISTYIYSFTASRQLFFSTTHPSIFFFSPYICKRSSPILAFYIKVHIFSMHHRVVCSIDPACAIDIL